MIRLQDPQLSYQQMQAICPGLLLQYMNNQGEIREQFLKAEAGVGITRANFNRRFVYQGEGADCFLLQRCTPSPSQLQGFTIEQEKGIGYLMSELIFRAAESLKLPVSTSAVAVSIAHYFYSRVGLLDQDFRDVAMGAVFLACKCEQTLRRSYEVSAVFDHVFKVFEGQRAPIKVLHSTQYEFMRKKVLHMENQILFEEGFEVFRLFDIPHRYIGGLFKAFDRHPQSRRIIQTAWAILNDFYRTNCMVHFPGQCIAAAAVYLALVRLGIKLPNVAWWILLECNLESIEELLGQLQCLYEASGRYSMEWAAAQINEVAHRHQLVNVFPVNYYRKIMLELSSQLKITVQPQPQPQSQPQSQSQPQLNNEDSRERSRERKKKRSKKDKKDKKKKKRRNSSESRSQDKERRSSNSREANEKNQLSVRNNDDTPKLKQEKEDNQGRMRDEKQEREERQESEAKQKESKEAVKQMQVGSAKGLLSLISSQLKMRETKRQKQPQPEEEAQLPPNPSGSDSDEEVLAELIKIRKSRLQQ